MMLLLSMLQLIINSYTWAIIDSVPLNASANPAGGY